MNARCIYKLILTLPGFLLLLQGCDKTDITPGFTPKYQIIATVEGEVYRLNSKSGAVFVVANGQMKKIPENEVTNLVVGGIYETENGVFHKYLGAGEFEVSEVVDVEVMADEILKEIFPDRD